LKSNKLIGALCPVKFAHLYIALQYGGYLFCGPEAPLAILVSFLVERDSNLLVYKVFGFHQKHLDHYGELQVMVVEPLVEPVPAEVTKPVLALV
jgi:hypothetical protein